jgi:trehalose 6-phosphate synthase
MGRNPDVLERAARLRADLGDPVKVILGVDRLDYTKGIEHRLKAYRELLADGRVKVQDTIMVQVAVPSRERVEHYKILRDKVEREVGRINGEFGVDGWQPVHYRYRALDRAELVAHFLAASVALVTPLRDGMNLVAAEFAASRVDGDGVLVLSEFAGIADLADGALLVNPNDTEGLAGALRGALLMPPEPRRERMGRLRAAILANPADAWAERCLSVGALPPPIAWNAT